MLVANAKTGKRQYLQDAEAIELLLHEENDDVNIVPFLPMDMLLNAMFRNGNFYPRIMATPTLNDAMEMRKFKLPELQDFHSLEAFSKFIHRKAIQAVRYGEKLKQRESLYQYRAIAPEPVADYYYMVQSFLGERDCIDFQSDRNDTVLTMTHSFDPEIAETRRCLWHENVDEAAFVAACQEEIMDTDKPIQSVTVIDCLQAQIEWKNMKQSVPVSNRVCYQPIEAYIHKKQPVLSTLSQQIMDFELENVENNDVNVYCNDIKKEILKNLQKLNQLQQENNCFQALEGDQKLLSSRCLPLIHQAVKANKTALRIKEFEEASTQVNDWEVEWNSEWSDDGTQTD